MDKNIPREATICKFELISLVLRNKFNDEASKIEFREKFNLSNKLIEKRNQIYNKNDIKDLYEIQQFIDRIKSPKKTR